MNRERLIVKLKQHEGFRSVPYNCSSGALTIGYGRNLDANGITQQESEMLLKNDVHDCEMFLRKTLSFFNVLTEPRQEVLLNMCFQLGDAGLMRFKRMIAALYNYDYEKASIEMLDSRWSEQCQERSKELSEVMRKGVWN